MSGHAYSLNDVFAIPNSNNAKRQHSRLLRVRNPWGRGEWKLKWSDFSDQIKQNKKALQDRIDILEDDEKFELGNMSDGTFLINFKSWRNAFNRIFVVNDFPDDWSAIRFRSEWTKKTSGGLPMNKTKQENLRFAKQPQYQFYCEEDCELFISLSQEDGREKDENGTYAKYPFKERIIRTMLFVFELP